MIHYMSSVTNTGPISKFRFVIYMLYIFQNLHAYIYNMTPIHRNTEHCTGTILILFGIPVAILFWSISVSKSPTNSEYCYANCYIFV